VRLHAIARHRTQRGSACRGGAKCIVSTDAQDTQQEVAMRGTNPLAALFGRSPFGPLQEHMKRVQACAEQLRPLFAALAASDLAAAAVLRDRVFELEHEADAIHDEIRDNLPRSLFLPVDRRDLLDLLSAQDSIADTVQDIASLTLLRGLTVPAALKDCVEKLVDATLATTRACGEVIGEIDELLESGFGGREAERVSAMIARVDELESESDARGLELVEQLFAHEEEMVPLDVVFWYKLIDLIGEVADHAESVGDRLRLLIAR